MTSSFGTWPVPVSQWTCAEGSFRCIRAVGDGGKKPVCVAHVGFRTTIASENPRCTLSFFTPATMPFADKRNHNLKVPRRETTLAQVPMGDQRFQQLMSELGAAFAQADDGQEKRLQARANERQRALWLTQREATIAEIVRMMGQHGLTIDDLT